MKNLRILVVALVLAAFAGPVLAAGTATLNVSANVLGTCLFNTGGTLDFGNLDPTNAVAVTAPSAGVTFTCTNGTGYTISDDAAAQPLGNGTSTIAYTLAYTATGSGNGTAQGLAITGDILAGTYATATAGAYTAAVTLSITP